MAAAYLVAETTAGWLTWLFAGTVVLLPTWATAWASIKRRLVVLAGLPPIAPRAAGRAGRLREVAFALVLAVVAILGTVAGTILLTAGEVICYNFIDFLVVSGNSFDQFSIFIGQHHRQAV